MYALTLQVLHTLFICGYITASMCLCCFLITRRPDFLKSLSCVVFVVSFIAYWQGIEIPYNPGPEGPVFTVDAYLMKMAVVALLLACMVLNIANAIGFMIEATTKNRWFGLICGNVLMWPLAIKFCLFLNAGGYAISGIG